VTGGSKKATDTNGRATFDVTATTTEPMSVDIFAWVEHSGAMGETGTGQGRTSVTVTSSGAPPTPINTPGFEALVAIAALGLASVGMTLLSIRRRK
jgi:hypothetical protein